MQVVAQHCSLSVSRCSHSLAISLRWPVVLTAVGLWTFQKQNFSQTQFVVLRLWPVDLRHYRVNPPDPVALDNSKSGEEFLELRDHGFLAFLVAGIGLAYEHVCHEHAGTGYEIGKRESHPLLCEGREGGKGE